MLSADVNGKFDAILSLLRPAHALAPLPTVATPLPTPMQRNSNPEMRSTIAGKLAPLPQIGRVPVSTAAVHSSQSQPQLRPHIEEAKYESHQEGDAGAGYYLLGNPPKDNSLPADSAHAVTFGATPAVLSRSDSSGSGANGPSTVFAFARSRNRSRGASIAIDPTELGDAPDAPFLNASPLKSKPAAKR